MLTFRQYKIIFLRKLGLYLKKDRKYRHCFLLGVPEIARICTEKRGIKELFALIFLENRKSSLRNKIFSGCSFLWFQMFLLLLFIQTSEQNNQ